MNNIPNLTSLRFFLAIFVVIYHLPQFFANRNLPYYNDLPIFNKGNEAVFMFFSLSGFLIIKQLFNEKIKSGTINLKAFYIRRILRIFPLYYLILIMGFLYYQLILPKMGFDFESNYPFWKGIVLSVTFFPNIFALYSPGGILEILWSIGIEEQFYIIIAPILLILPVKRIYLFLVFFSFTYYSIYFLEPTSWLIKCRMMFFYFSFSGFCAILLENNNFKLLMQKIKTPIFFLFLIYFFTSFFCNHFTDFFYHIFGMILFGFTLSILSLKSYHFLENKTLNYLGKISYGIYMYHAIVLQFVGFIAIKIYKNLPDFLLILMSYVGVILLTILISHLSYQHYEKFFLNLKNKFR